MKAKQSRPSLLAQVVGFAALVNLVLLPLSGADALERASPVKIVAFGDSLTAGYMLKPAESFPAQLAKALNDNGQAVEVLNAGVSGDTTGAGLERLEWAIPEGTEAVILELGANDALRGIDPQISRAALDRIMASLRARNIEVLIAGMQAPKNWGDTFEKDFNAIFGELSKKYDALLYPFFLDGIAMQPALTLPDGLHPTGNGVAVIVERIQPQVEALIARVDARRVAAAKP